MADPLHVDVPQSDEAERSVLGAIIVENEHLDDVAEILGPQDFYRVAHQRIFRSMLELSEESTPIDLLTLHDRHRGDGTLEAVGGPAYLSQLMDGIPRLINVRHYAQIVRERSIRRQIVKTASDLVGDATTNDKDVEQLLNEAEQRIFAIAEQRMPLGFRPMKELLEESFEVIEARQKAGTSITGVPSGFSRLDEMTSGFQPGDLIVLAARPAMGKTSWALSVAQHASIRHRKTVAIFSLEMSCLQLAMRMMFSEARVDAQLMRRGRLADRHWAKLAQAFSRLAEAPIFLDDATGTSTTEMRARARRLKAERGLDMIVVDYLQLMSGGGRQQDNRQQEISSISRSLKEMARELEVPVLALSQLSRAPDQRTGDHRPHLSDLRESGSLEQDADVVAFIFREEVYLQREGKEPGEAKGIAELIVAKQRNGPTDTVKLAFIKEWTRFENLQRDDAGTPDAAGAGQLAEGAEAAVVDSLGGDDAPVDDRAPF